MFWVGLTEFEDVFLENDARGRGGGGRVNVDFAEIDFTYA